MSAAAPAAAVTAAGARLMLAAAAAFAGMTAAAKLLGARLPLFEIVFVRAAFSTLATLWLLRRAGEPVLGSRRPLLWLRGLFGFCGLSCSFYAVIHLPLAEATLLQFTHPLFTVALAALLLGERIERGVLFGLPLSVLGILAVARPEALFGGASSLDSFAVGVGLAGAFFAADAYVSVRHLARTGEHPLAIVLSFPLVTSVLSAPLMLQSFVWPSGVEWLWLLAAGAFAQIGQLSLTRGIQLLPASRATVFSYTQIVFAAALGALLFGERPDAWTAAGGALVLGGAWLASRAAV
ncbi:MAG TPA: DMT family transporter [Myxococcota bacterium]|nr:DMT family transporter [Myxococcota bacterium]